MQHSALINVMVKAALRAGRSLKRDLGEIEHLQVSLKGPANFVSLADNADAEVEYAIALFNGTGTPKNIPAAVALLRKAAKQGNAIAQNRLARVQVSGMGVPVDKIDGLKWHLVAKTAGKGDLFLDEAYAQLSPEERAKVDAITKVWLGTAAPPPNPAPNKPNMTPAAASATK